MSGTTKTKGDLFKELRSQLELTDLELGFIFGLGDKMEQMSIRRKLRDNSSKSYRAPSKADLLAIQLLKLLESEGYDLRSLSFDANGELQKPSKAQH